MMLAPAIGATGQVLSHLLRELCVVAREVHINVRLEKDAHARAREGICWHGHLRFSDSSSSASELRSCARARWRRDLMAGMERLRLWLTCSSERSA